MEWQRFLLISGSSTIIATSPAADGAPLVTFGGKDTGRPRWHGMDMTHIFSRASSSILLFLQLIPVLAPIASSRSIAFGIFINHAQPFRRTSALSVWFRKGRDCATPLGGEHQWRAMSPGSNLFIFVISKGRQSAHGRWAYSQFWWGRIPGSIRRVLVPSHLVAPPMAALLDLPVPLVHTRAVLFRCTYRESNTCPVGNGLSWLGACTTPEAMRQPPRPNHQACVCRQCDTEASRRSLSRSGIVAAATPSPSTSLMGSVTLRDLSLPTELDGRPWRARNS